MEDCLDLESSFQMVAAARAFVRSRLADWELRNHADDAVLVASELVTNAVLHARSAVRLRLLADGPAVRVEVYDENTRLPVPGASGADATSGRGMAVVSAVAESWGMELQGDGKIVWAEFGAATEANLSEPDDCLDLSEVDSVDEALGRVYDPSFVDRPQRDDSGRARVPSQRTDRRRASA